jgi:hypothetical protein
MQPRPAPKISGKSESFPSERDLMLSTGDARPTPAPAAKVTADKVEALHRSRLSRACPLRPKSRRKGEARLGP